MERFILDKLYGKYLAGIGNPGMPGPMSAGEFAAFAERTLEGCSRVMIGDAGQPEGALFYHAVRDGTRAEVVVPLHGLYCSSVSVLHRLFTKAAEETVTDGPTRFSVYLYANDTEAERYFMLEQFGCMYEQGCMRIDDPGTEAPVRKGIRILPKGEVRERWSEIWSLTDGILDQLRASPVFYACEEFTEQVYRGFFLDPDTTLFGAFGEDGRLLGIIETNHGSDPLSGLVLHGERSANVGEIFVRPGYRGSGISGELLLAAARKERAEGNDWLWVGHGTANFFGRRFWDRYFMNYAVELVRTIAPVPSRFAEPAV